MNFKNPKNLLIIVGLLTTMIISGTLIADTSIFFCEETSAYGAAWGVPLAKARQVAKQYCEDNGGTNCQELLSCKTGFAAIATDDEGTIGASCGASNQAEADRLSIESCREYSSNPDNCKVKHQWRG